MMIKRGRLLLWRLDKVIVKYVLVGIYKIAVTNSNHNKLQSCLGKVDEVVDKYNLTQFYQVKRSMQIKFYKQIIINIATAISCKYCLGT